MDWVARHTRMSDLLQLSQSGVVVWGVLTLGAAIAIVALACCCHLFKSRVKDEEKRRTKAEAALKVALEAALAAAPAAAAGLDPTCVEICEVTGSQIDQQLEARQLAQTAIINIDSRLFH